VEIPLRGPKGDDLSAFYELVSDDELSWCATGAGRMLRAPNVTLSATPGTLATWSMPVTERVGCLV
jgi:hypothetical protein